MPALQAISELYVQNPYENKASKKQLDRMTKVCDPGSGEAEMGMSLGLTAQPV